MGLGLLIRVETGPPQLPHQEERHDDPDGDEKLPESRQDPVKR